MKAPEILEGLSVNEKRLLLTLDQLDGKATPEEAFQKGGFEQKVEVMNAASWLASKGLVGIDETARKVYFLKDETILEKKLPERRAAEYINSRGGSIEMGDLSKVLPKEEVSIAIGWLKRKGLAEIKKEGGRTVLSLTSGGKQSISEPTEDEKTLYLLSKEELPESKIDKKVAGQLKSRQDLIEEKLVVDRTINLTHLGGEVIQVGIEIKDEVAQLTPELIQTGRWKEVSFRKYDVRTFAPAVYPGKKHPLTRIADEVRRIFVEMGFEEIDEEYIQSAFWNMDALFTPQDHPARDIQDTFYLSSPSTLPIEDEEIMRRVKEMHERGGDTSSVGWGYEWKKEEAEKALLRTHTTVNTIKYLWKHPNPPVKVFSLSRVFRKEAIDSTHLPEFVQLEGIIMEKDANFDMLCGVLKDFYYRMGFRDVRFRPGYFPYTEPSLEVDVHFEGRWMELGGAGVFRPEVTAPFGIKYPVLAWGQGFERLAMLRWGIKDIRDLYISDVEMLRQNPIL